MSKKNSVESCVDTVGGKSVAEEKNDVAGSAAEENVNVAEEKNDVAGSAAEENVSVAEQNVNVAEELTTAGFGWQPKKSWPKNCPWPEPVEWSCHYDEYALFGNYDAETEELLKIKEYFDSLVDDGKLNDDYTPTEEFEDELDDFVEGDEAFPRIGGEYWEDGFDLDGWRDELSNHVNLFRIAPMDPHKDPTVRLYNIIHYHFINENLLRQAFTRRAFAIEYGIEGCSEELEFLGDSVLSSVVTKELFSAFSEIEYCSYEAPFYSKYDEGQLTKLRERYTCKEALSARARELGLGNYILYGTGEKENESSLEDMMEALIGAVVIDCGWNMGTIERVVNELILIQFTEPDSVLKTSYYDILNSWHQKHFGCMPNYEVHEIMVGIGKSGGYCCNLRFQVPENDKKVRTKQFLSVNDDTRSKAREKAARRAFDFIFSKGLWKRLDDAKVIPDMENSINQLQELYQKKYLDNKPVYEYEDRHGTE